MKLKLKMIAIAAAMAAAGSAHADLVGANTGNSSVALLAFDQQSGSYYVRDLGYTLNTFLPSSVTTSAGDGGVTGDKSPEAGLVLNKTTNSSFADSSFSTWLASTGYSTGDTILWTIAGGDQLTTGANGVARTLLASSTSLTVSNGTVRNAVATGSGVTVLATQNNPFTLSSTGTSVPASFTGNNILQSSTLTTLGSSANVYYFYATTQTGSSSTNANEVEFGNSQNFATLTLAANGDLTYSLAPAVSAVPIPAAVWLLGSGIAGMGGFARRRKAAAAAA